MLVGNYSVFNKCPGKWRSGTSLCDRSSYNRPGDSRGMYYNDSSVFNTSPATITPTHLLTSYGIPSGTVAWIIPQTSGGMAMRLAGDGNISQSLIPQYPTSTSLSGSGNLIADIYGVGNILSNLVGSTSFSAAISATGNILISATGSGTLTADIMGDGSIVFNATGSGSLSGGASLFYNMLCAMTGSGSLSGDASLLVSMLCSMDGNSIMTASITGVKSMTASFTGAGNLSGNIEAFGNMVCSLLGSGLLNADISAIADMSIDIVVTGTGLNTQNVGAAVWQAILSEFSTDPNSAAAKLLGASAAGDPWSTNLPGTYTGDQAGKLLLEYLKKIKAISSANL